jgi:hypothetical protein
MAMLPFVFSVELWDSNVPPSTTVVMNQDDVLGAFAYIKNNVTCVSRSATYHPSPEVEVEATIACHGTALGAFTFKDFKGRVRPFRTQGIDAPVCEKEWAHFEGHAAEWHSPNTVLYGVSVISDPVNCTLQTACAHTGCFFNVLSIGGVYIPAGDEATFADVTVKCIPNPDSQPNGCYRASSYVPLTTPSGSWNGNFESKALSMLSMDQVNPSAQTVMCTFCGLEGIEPSVKNPGSDCRTGRCTYWMKDRCNNPCGTLNNEPAGAPCVGSPHEWYACGLRENEWKMSRVINTSTGTWTDTSNTINSWVPLTTGELGYTFPSISTVEIPYDPVPDSATVTFTKDNTKVMPCPSGQKAPIAGTEMCQVTVPYPCGAAGIKVMTGTIMPCRNLNFTDVSPIDNKGWPLNQTFTHIKDIALQYTHVTYGHGGIIGSITHSIGEVASGALRATESVVSDVAGWPLKELGVSHESSLLIIGVLVAGVILWFINRQNSVRPHIL